MIKLLKKVLNYGGVLLLIYMLISLALLFINQSNIDQYSPRFVTDDYSLLDVYPRDYKCNEAELKTIKSTVASFGTSSLIILKNDHLVAEYGNSHKKFNGHSIRKSLISLLYGIAIDKDLIDPSLTLLELDISDWFPSLTPLNRSATINDLLSSKSGIYHHAAAQSSGQRKRFPKQLKVGPGEHWAYNNWDYNALGSIFEKEVGLSIGEAFYQWIAVPLELQDFEESDVKYLYSPKSKHPSYPFWISSRDLLKIGIMVKDNGIYNAKEVVPSKWIKLSTTAHTNTYRGGNGLMWWTKENSNVIFASGSGTQKLYIDKANNLIVVHRVDTGSDHMQNFMWFVFGSKVKSSDFFKLISSITVACEE